MNDALFGSTRTYVGPRHAVITPDGHVASALRGAEKVRIIYHITPALGAAFTQATLFFSPAGKITWPIDIALHIERFLYVETGEVALRYEGRDAALTPGAYAFLAPGSQAELSSTAAATVIMFEKIYEAGAMAVPRSVIGHASEVVGTPFLGNEKAMLQVLLPPDDFALDLAVNLFTYQPGATLPFVETHIMEHGLLMLSGQGIYRLEDKWYPVQAGDVIWMAPYCPQWFVAMGDEPASYLYYKDVNRHPLA